MLVTSKPNVMALWPRTALPLGFDEPLCAWYLGLEKCSPLQANFRGHPGGTRPVCQGAAGTLPVLGLTQDRLYLPPSFFFSRARGCSWPCSRTNP